MTTESRPVVLCIDDDPDILSYLQVVLTAEGFEYRGARSSEEGLLEYKKAAPDVIIIDLMMEEVDSGVGLAKELRLLNNQAPMFMFSSVGDSLNLTADYAGLGLAGIFQKPLDKERLLAVLRAATRPVEA